MKIGSLTALAAAALLLTLGALAPASAQRADDAGMNAQNACQGDAYRFCNDAIPDRAKVASCLFRHKREISSACRTVIGGGGGKKVGKARRGGRHHGRGRRRR